MLPFAAQRRWPSWSTGVGKHCGGACDVETHSSKWWQGRPALRQAALPHTDPNLARSSVSTAPHPPLPRACPPPSRKASLRSDDCSGDCVPARFESRLWPRLDAGGIADGAVLRLDDYTLRCAADGRGDWCVPRSALVVS